MGNLPKLTQFVAGSMTKSINIHSPDLGPNLEYSPATINVSQGITEGTGPRHGMAPIPGHSDRESLIAGQFPGIMASEANWITSEYARVNIYAIHPLVFGGINAAITTRMQYYAVVVGYTSTNFPGNTYLDVIFLATYVNTPPNAQARQSANIYDGLGFPGLYQARTGSLATGPFLEFLTSNYSLSAEQKVEQFQRLISPQKYVSSTPFAVNQAAIQTAWLVGSSGGPVGQGGATTAPSIAIAFGLTATNGTVFCNFGAGLTSDINYGNFDQVNRVAKMYALTQTGDQNIDYSLTFPPTATIFKPSYDAFNSSLGNIILSGVTATKDTAGTAYASTALGLYNDDAVMTNASYQGVLVAAQKAYCIIVQDWLRSYNGMLEQYVDLVNNPYQPQSVATQVYTEDGAKKATCLGQWPVFVTGTACAGINTISLGTVAGSGLLRANTVYEIGLAIYNKRLNFETNVGTPVKIQTGTVDNVPIILFDSSGTQKTQAAYAVANLVSTVPVPGGVVSSTLANTNPMSINHLEYRFYYRPLGQQEWLPALFIDAPKWWFYPRFTKLSMCTGGIGAQIGGRPGGLNDYSPLPPDQYNCVVIYKNRAFWFSDKALVFSLQDNVFAYPAGNTAAVPVGSLKGALVQAYYGQAQQDARLVIFTTAGTFVGKFSGNPQVIPVQISSTTVASFPLDGSDFEINAWTSISAYSYRSAVVAEGILYMWGPSGVFRDDGVTFITRISMPLEPDIFNYCDPAQTDAICTLYNDTSKEIYWFYPPKVADGYATHALVYNTVRESWLFAKFSGSIDHAQQIVVKSGVATAGTRGVVYTRQNAAATVQRAAYFDQNNRACDIFPTGELMVKSFTTPSAGQRAFTLAAGYDATKFATIAAGDLIAVSQAAAYASTLVTPTDFIGTVVSAAAGVITVALPSGVAFDASATFATNALYMPIWHFKPAANGINGFPYMLDSYYWLPGGFSYWAYWLHVHMLFKLTQILPAATPLTFNFAYRTPVSDQGEIGQDIVFANNSDTNFQVMHPLQVGNQNLEGQGLKFTISGIQGAGGWMIQYLEAYTQYLDGLQLKLFEG